MSDPRTIDDAVDKQLLDEIQHQLILLGQQSGNRLESFSEPYSPGKDWLIKYQEHLKTLSNNIAGKSGCKPACPGGSCPPCFGWPLEEYNKYLESLRRLTA